MAKHHPKPPTTPSAPAPVTTPAPVGAAPVTPAPAPVGAAPVASAPPQVVTDNLKILFPITKLEEEVQMEGEVNQ